MGAGVGVGVGAGVGSTHFEFCAHVLPVHRHFLLKRDVFLHVALREPSQLSTRHVPPVSLLQAEELSSSRRTQETNSGLVESKPKPNKTFRIILKRAVLYKMEVGQYVRMPPPRE